ncbi:MAG: DUF3570 domain-containing protein [Bacteroidales bacterium]|nr:DUF3570 domain-containing protein [Bacteroidales bacterium]
MKKIILLILLSLHIVLSAQTKQDSTNKNTNYKKRVLENVEIDLLTSYYTQNGVNAAVTGGIGDESLDDFATNLVVSIPLNDDDVLTIDGTISAYTSASSSNLNPFSGASSGASSDYDDDDDDKKKAFVTTTNQDVTGTPWAASSGASKSDVWVSGTIGYSHSSDNRNNIYTAHVSFANEFDYTSFGAGLGYSRLFNQKNTEIGINASVYLDQWRPEYPTEIHTYVQYNGNLDGGFFSGVPILDQNGLPIDKLGTDVWNPVNMNLVNNNGRNTYSVSLSFSQILGKKTQISIFGDFVMQEGWLANPMQRVYFADKANYYIGNATDIPIYTSTENQRVFQLADDIERLPDTRMKIPVGLRFNQYINEFIVIRTYYRFYYDDWGIYSHTANIEIPVKLGMNFTIYPTYRYYTQTAADYFAPYETHLSTETYYTSDYDLSEFYSNQFGFGIKYTNILMKKHLGKIAVKNIDLHYNYYQRDSGFDAHIVSLGFKFVIE